MKRAVALLAVLALAGCASDDVERALQETLPPDVTVVKNSCSRDGETAAGHEHWVCVLHYPETVLTGSMNRRWDVAVDNGRIVGSSPQG